MNILMINHYAGSLQMGMVFRPYYMGKIWNQGGHNVTIITSSYSHLRRKNPIIDHDWQEDSIDGIKYIWVKTRKYQGNGVDRAMSMFEFVGKILLNVNNIVDKTRPDVVIAASTYQFDTYAAQKISKRSGAVYIHEIRDMWPITLKEIGNMSAYNPFVFLMQRAENSFCKHCDYVTSTLEYAKEYFIQHGLAENKFRYVPNGISKDDWDTQEKIPNSHNLVIQELKKEGRFLLCFFGSHTKSYALDNLIEAIRKLPPDKNICVVFVGKGNYKNILQEKTSKEKEKFVFLDPVPKTCIPQLLNLMDALYVGALKNDMFRFGISMNKLFDSMMSGKPIIYAVDAPNNYVRDFKCGISVEAENVDALKDAISTIYCMSESERTWLGNNGKTAALEHFEYNILANQYLQIMEEGIKNNGQRKNLKKN